MAQECQRPILGIAILLWEEAIMCSAAVLATDGNRVEGWGSWEARPEGFLAWEVDSTPRLEASDLSHPEGYHRRLETYIMNLK